VIRIKQHIPGFCDGLTPKRADVSSVEELLASPWVGRLKDNYAAKDGKLYRIPFHRFSVARGSLPYTLMIERDGGRDWHVLGFLEGDAVDLPEWVPVREGESLVQEISREEMNRVMQELGPPPRD
jgi:hypothetical protein